MAVFPNLQMHWLIGVLVILGLAVVFVRRLYFSPLSKFPGPKLAAATILYEAYYDIIKQGQYIFKIKELHKKYGGYINALRECALLILEQVPSSVSTHGNFTSTILSTTGCYIVKHHLETSICSLQASLISRIPSSVQLIINTTDFDANRWALSFRSKAFCVLNRRSHQW